VSHKLYWSALAAIERLERIAKELTMAKEPTRYDREDLTIHDDGPRYVVNDPWTAQDRGYFLTEADAELFADAISRKERKG